MAKKVLYLDRNGNKISADEFIERAADPEYAQVRAFDNGRVRVFLNWTGKIANPDQTFEGYRKLFTLEVWNYSESGNLTRDPAYPQTFPDQDSAVTAYEAFIERWTASERDREGKLVEVGNSLVPPPPPNPDMPLSEPIDDDENGVGAW